MQTADFLGEKKMHPLRLLGLHFANFFFFFCGVRILASSAASLCDFLFVYWYFSLHYIDFCGPRVSWNEKDY
jgi:hypothetical protein